MSSVDGKLTDIAPGAPVEAIGGDVVERFGGVAEVPVAILKEHLRK